MPFLLGKNSWDVINVAFRGATMLNPRCQVNDFLFIFFSWRKCIFFFEERMYFTNVLSLNQTRLIFSTCDKHDSVKWKISLPARLLNRRIG